MCVILYLCIFFSINFHIHMDTSKEEFIILLNNLQDIFAEKLMDFQNSFLLLLLFEI